MEEEQAQRKLFEAATKGCITSVKQLMIDEPSIREALRQTLSCSDDESKSTKRMRKKKKSIEETIKDWLEKKKNSLMVVASLLATMCFQVGVSGVWQEDNYLVNSKGYAVMARNDLAAYEAFSVYNTIGFVSSLSIIFLLMSGLPVRNRFFMWILMAITWIAISATAMTYNVAVDALTPNDTPNDTNLTYIIKYSVYLWIGLTLLILIAHGIRLLSWLVKTFQVLLKLLKLPFNCCHYKKNGF